MSRTRWKRQQFLRITKADYSGSMIKTQCLHDNLLLWIFFPRQSEASFQTPALWISLIQFWGFKKLLAAVFEKSSMLDAWMGYECVSEIGAVSFFYKYIFGNKRSLEKLSKII